MVKEAATIRSAITSPNPGRISVSGSEKETSVLPVIFMRKPARKPSISLLTVSREMERELGHVSVLSSASSMSAGEDVLSTKKLL